MSSSTVPKAIAAIIAVCLLAPNASEVFARRTSAAADHQSLRASAIVGAGDGRADGADLRARTRGGRGSQGRVAPQRKVVLFVHGAGTPAEVAFDTPFSDHSWMAYLANAGHDVFAMDQTGYGRSTRPTVMNDPCNLSAAQQATFVPALLAAPCAPSYPHQLGTIESEWDEINAVVDYVRVCAGRSRESRRVVARSASVRRIYGEIPGQSRIAGDSRAGLQSVDVWHAARVASRRRRADEHAVARRIHRQLGPAGGVRESVPFGGP